MKTPYIGFGNDQLKDAPNVKEGDLVECKICSGVHPVEFGMENGKKSKLLGFFKCGEKTYLASISGKLMMGIKPAVSGRV